MSKKVELPQIETTPTTEVEINEQFGFPNVYPLDNIRVYYVFEYAKRYLLDPISWIERPSTMPEGIKELNPEPLVLLYVCYDSFNQGAFNVMKLGENNKPLKKDCFTSLDSRLKQKTVIEHLKEGIRLFYNLDSWIKDVSTQAWLEYRHKEIESCFATNITEAIFKMVNDMRYYVFLALGVRTTNSIIYDDHEKEILQCKNEIQEIKDYITNSGSSNQRIIWALLEEVDGISLIVPNEKCNGLYVRNKEFNKSHIKGKWFKEAEKRIKNKGLKMPVWKQLGRDFIRQEDGTEYQNINQEIHKW